MSDTVSTLAQKLRPFWLRDLGASTPATTGGSGMVSHALSGPYHTGTLDPSQAPWALTITRTLTAGAGLTGGGDLSADRSFAVGAGAGITVNADDVALTTPGTLTVSSTNTATGSHTHAITSSSNPGAAASLLATTAAGLLTLQNGAFVQAAQSNATFATGFAGSGWRVDYGVTTASRASAEFDDLTVRGRMRVYELLIQQIRATNGSLLVTSSSKALSVTTSTNPAWTVNGVLLTLNGTPAELTTTIYTIATATSGEDAASKRTYHGFLYGDIIRAQQVEWNGSSFAGVIQSNLEVTGVASLYEYSATLVSGNAAAVGYDYVRLGSTTDSSRRGVVYLTSDDSAAPFIDIADNISYHSDWNTPGAIKVRLGKLTGISDTDFGGTLSGYGLYGNNVYLKGKIVVTGGSLGGLAAADINSNTTTIDGGRITTGTVTAGQIAANTITASQIAANTITASQIAANTITGNKLSLTTTIGINSLTFGNSGIQLDYNAGTPRFYAGNGSSSFLQYNGTNVSMTGFITATGGSFTGGVYCGSNAVRFSTDGQRLVLPNTTGPDIPTSSSAIRWFAGIDDTWTNSANYVGLTAYRHTGSTVVDGVMTVVVGDTDDATYDARLVLQAGHYASGVYSDSNLIITREKSTGNKTVNANCDTFNASNNVYVTNNCSALSFTDRTPFFDGDAMAELRNIKGKTNRGKKEIDHSTLPAFARKRIQQRGSGDTEEGRDLGAMISILVVAVQQLDARLDALEGRGNGNR